MSQSCLTAIRCFDHLPDRAMSEALLHEIATTQVTPQSRRVDKLLGLYGAGDMGRFARKYLERIGIPIAFVVDRDAKQLADSQAWKDLILLRPQDVSEELKRDSLLAVSVATVPYALLKADLVRNGWSDVVPFYDIAEAYRDLHPLSNGWIAPPFSTSDVEGIITVLHGWEDDISRAHHLQFIAWRRLRSEWHFAGAPVTIYDRYFIPEIHRLLMDTESFADIGAYNGSVIMRFLTKVAAICGPIWAVEPDPDNLAMLKETLARLPQGVHVKVIPAIVAKKAVGNACFAQGLDYASQLTDLGTTRLQTSTIDSLEISPSFIKLHLEGGELSALEGAVRTLERYRPILAVTSYHNLLGLWRLPDWLYNTLLNYRFLMRLHSWVGTGAVIYGIPEERMECKNL